MDLKRLSIILAGVMLIAFGVGLYSLLYIDNFRMDHITESGFGADIGFEKFWKRLHTNK